MKVKLISDDTCEKVDLVLPMVNENFVKVDIDLIQLMKVFGKKYKGYTIKVIEDDERINLKNCIRKSDNVFELNKLLYIFDKLENWEIRKLKEIVEAMQEKLSIKKIIKICYELENITFHKKIKTLEHVGMYLMNKEMLIENFDSVNFKKYAKEKLENSKSILTEYGFLEFKEK